MESKNYIPNCSYKDFVVAPVTMKDTKVVHTDVNNRRLTLTRGIVYKSADGQDLTITLISPDYIEQRVEPCIVFVQGSGWFQQNLDDHLFDLYPIAMKGYKIAVVEYRPSNVRKYPAQIEDTEDAYRFMYEHAEEYNIDKNKMCIMGDSSGGHTVLEVMANIEKNKLPMNCVIDLYGLVEFDKINDYPSCLDHFSKYGCLGMLLGGVEVLENLDLAREASILHKLKKETAYPDLLIIHGTKDRLVPYNQSELLYNKMKELQKNSTFITVEGGDHGGPTIYIPEVYEIINKFIESHL